MRLWSVNADEAAFTPTAWDKAMTDYTGRNAVAHHCFCATCGSHAFDRIDLPNMTGQLYCYLSVTCLDERDVDELLATPVT